MADVPVSLATLNGIAKEVYADGVKQLVPDGTKLQKLVPFSTKEKQGGFYHQPVLLSYEHGFTFAGPNAGAFTLGDSVSSVMQDAKIAPNQILLKGQCDYETAARAQRGKAAFVDATALLFESMQKSMRKRLEVECLYGSAGLATVASLTSQDITVTTGQWASGIWMGMENAYIDVYVGATNTVRQAGLRITAIDSDTRKISVSGTVTGIASGDTIYYAGAKNAEMVGVFNILTNTGALFGIDASQYTLWKSSSFNAAGALSQAKVGAAVAAAVGKGLDDDLVLMVNPATWNNLLNDQAALARHTGKDIKMTVSNGSQDIEFYSQNGKIAITPSIYIKEGHCLGLTPDNWKRLGAVDVSFKTPGQGDDLFLQMPTKAGFEVRAYTNQSIFCEAPNKNLLITGVVNS